MRKEPLVCFREEKIYEFQVMEDILNVAHLSCILGHKLPFVS